MDRIDGFFILLPALPVVIGASIAIARLLNTRSEIRSLLKQMEQGRDARTGTVRGKPYTIRPTVMRPGIAFHVQAAVPGQLQLKHRERGWLGTPQADEGRTGDIRFDGRFRITGANRDQAAELLNQQSRALIVQLFSLPVERLILGPSGRSAWVPERQFRQIGTGSLREILQLLAKIAPPTSDAGRASTPIRAAGIAWPPVATQTKTKPNAGALQVGGRVADSPPRAATHPSKPAETIASSQRRPAKAEAAAPATRKRVFPVIRMLLLLGVSGLVMLAAGLALFRPLDPDLYFTVRGAEFITDVIGFTAGVAIVFTLPALLWRKGKILRVLFTGLLGVIALPLFAGGLFALLNGLLAAPLDHHQIVTVLRMEIEDPEAPAEPAPAQLHPEALDRPEPFDEALSVLAHLSKPIFAEENQPLRVLKLSSPINGRGYFSVYSTEQEFQSTAVGGKLRLVTRRGWLAGDLVIALEPISEDLRWSRPPRRSRRGG